MTTPSFAPVTLNPSPDRLQPPLELLNQLARQAAPLENALGVIADCVESGVPPETIAAAVFRDSADYLPPKCGIIVQDGVVMVDLPQFFSPLNNRTIDIRLPLQTLIQNVGERGEATVAGLREIVASYFHSTNLHRSGELRMRAGREKVRNPATDFGTLQNAVDKDFCRTVLALGFIKALGPKEVAFLSNYPEFQFERSAIREAYSNGKELLTEDRASRAIETCLASFSEVGGELRSLLGMRKDDKTRRYEAIHWRPAAGWVGLAFNPAVSGSTLAERAASVASELTSVKKIFEGMGVTNLVWSANFSMAIINHFNVEIGLDFIKKLPLLSRLSDWESSTPLQNQRALEVCVTDVLVLGGTPLNFEQLSKVSSRAFGLFRALLDVTTIPKSITEDRTIPKGTRGERAAVVVQTTIEPPAVSGQLVDMTSEGVVRRLERDTLSVSR